MLDVQPPTARRRLAPAALCLIRRLARAGAVGRALAAIAAGAAFAACAVPPEPLEEDAGTRAVPDRTVDPDGDDGCPDPAPADPRAMLAHSAVLEEVPCVVGAWITAPRECACPAPGAPGDTPECAEDDCQEVDLLLMIPDGAAFRATLRVSRAAAELSAVGGAPRAGAWEHLDDGELRLEFEGNAFYTPTECRGDELQPKGQPALHRPPPALDTSIFWAWLTDEWTSAPYFGL